MEPETTIRKPVRNQDELWTIDRIEIQGHSSFSEFNLSIRFNRDEKHFILPEEADLQVCYHA